MSGKPTPHLHQIFYPKTSILGWANFSSEVGGGLLLALTPTPQNNLLPYLYSCFSPFSPHWRNPCRVSSPFFFSSATIKKNKSFSLFGGGAPPSSHSPHPLHPFF